MNVFELLSFVLALLLSFLFERYFYRYMGWFAVVPAVGLGFGIVALVLVMVRKLGRAPSKGAK